ncbi:MAG TPA: hypothetical protein ENH25_06160 [candidate division Zixibacteria bacterium]|nr:hypothetical protein [candidate division Zixibacteria bacterium]
MSEQNYRKKLFLIPIMLVCLIINAHSIVSAEEPIPITQKMKTDIIDSVTAIINEIYIFPEVAAKLEKHLKNNLQAGKYDKFRELVPFVEQLKTDFYEIGQDRHLRIFSLSREFCAKYKSNEEAKEYFENSYFEESVDDHGIKRVEIMPGNIGYMDLYDFIKSTNEFESIAAAMTLLSNCDAVIIDLRRNGGGDGGVVAFLASYFFEERSRLNDAYIRKTDSVDQYWTFPVPGAEAFYNKDLYVLIGNATFSAAEDFAYAMQAQKRATIIGEKTRGGGHPIEMFFFINHYVSIDVPNAYSINSITGTNWEGTGVHPEIETTFEKAVDVAYLKALENLLEKADNDVSRNKIKWAISGLQMKQNPVDVDPDIMQKYAGDYGKRKIIYKDGHLFYQRNDKSTFRLYPMTENIFGFLAWDEIRIEFVKDNNAIIPEFRILHPDGHKSVYKRN